MDVFAEAQVKVIECLELGVEKEQTRPECLLAFEFSGLVDMFALNEFWMDVAGILAQGFDLDQHLSLTIVEHAEFSSFSACVGGAHPGVLKALFQFSGTEVRDCLNR